jgi:hypothetical protein
MTLRLRVLAVLGALAAAGFARADAPPAVQDDAHLFNPAAAEQASAQLHDIGAVYGLDFLLQTVEKPPEDVQKQLKGAKDAAQKNKILHAWGEEEAQKAASDAVHILVCKDAVHGWVWTYGCVVVTVPPERRSAKFTDADARTLHDRLKWFTRGDNRAKNDAILLSSVARIRDDLYTNHLPPFPWLPVGGVMAGALGLWGVLALVRLRLRTAAPPEARSPGLFAALLGGMFGGAASHWIYDTLFVASSRFVVVAEPPAPAAPPAPQEAVAVEPTKAERLDFAARDHPTEEPSAPGPARF